MINFRHSFGGAVAQLGARLDGIEEVVGSNPIGSTNLLKGVPGTVQENLCRDLCHNCSSPNLRCRQLPAGSLKVRRAPAALPLSVHASNELAFSAKRARR